MTNYNQPDEEKQSSSEVQPLETFSINDLLATEFDGKKYTRKQLEQKYEHLQVMYTKLQREHEATLKELAIVRETAEHTVNEARDSRDFYMGLYKDLLDEKEVAA